MTVQDHSPRPSSAAPRMVLSDFLARIEAAAEVARDADAYRNDAHRRRNALIVEAVDSGAVSQRAAAKAAGLAQTRIIKLLSQSDEMGGWG